MKKILKPIAMITIVVFLPFSSFMGCSSTPIGVSYSFAENDSQSAMINFDSGNPGVSLISFEGTKLPKPKESTYWKDLTFPAGEPLTLTVHAKYTAPSPMIDIAGAIGGNYIGAFIALPFLALALVVDLPMAIFLGVNKKVAFICPPLEANRTYVLRLRRRNRGEGATRALVLIDVETDMIVFEHEF